MKRYLRTCFYFNNFDAFFAFLSLIAIAIGSYELVIRAEGVINNPKAVEFLKTFSENQLWYAIGVVAALNYLMLLRTNPWRFFVCLLLLPIRILFVGIIVLIKLLPIIFTLLAAAAAGSANDNRKKSNDKKNYNASQRQKFREDLQNDLKTAAVLAGSAAVSVYGKSRVSGSLESRIRSLNDQYIVKG